ncbi:MAG TPA: DUF58 domain-containing protein [Longimicrobiales bacterium]|nr:DUF58 domain-containing protein [Longimicrobiales bacterium]
MNDHSAPGRQRADPRLPAYLIGGFGALVAAITTGHQELAALGAPFLVLAAIGLVRREPTRLRGSVTLHTDRVIEGDVITGEVHVDWDGEAQVDIMISDLRGVTPIQPEPLLGWSLPPRGGPVTLPFEVRASSWGSHDAGTLWVRARRAGGLLAWEQKLATAPRLRVLPTPTRLDRLLKPAAPRTIAGVHLSRFRGHGTDFAELRPYQPGDRMRDLSWSTSARLGEPWVTVHHLERTGTVLLFLDAFFGSEHMSTEALARTARAAWAVASVHLRAQDRVGLLAEGRTTAWLPPRGGRRARWLLLDQLLAVGGAAEDVWQRSHRSTRIVVPSDALILGVTSLRSHAFLRTLLHYRRAGHTSGALVIDTADLLPDATDRVGEAARRIWLAQNDAARHALERGGVPTAVVASEGVGPAIAMLRRRMNSSRTARPRVTA